MAEANGIVLEEEDCRQCILEYLDTLEWEYRRKERPTSLAFRDARRFLRCAPSIAFNHMAMDITEDKNIEFVWDTEDLNIAVCCDGEVGGPSFWARDWRIDQDYSSSSFDPSHFPKELHELLLSTAETEDRAGKEDGE